MCHGIGLGYQSLWGTKSSNHRLVSIITAYAPEKGLIIPNSSSSFPLSSQVLYDNGRYILPIPEILDARHDCQYMS